MAQTLKTVTDGREVTVVFNGEDQPCQMTVTYVDFKLTTIDNETFPNPRALSAQLRSEISYESACYFLHDNKIPPTSGLWLLNHEGWPGDAFFEGRNV